MFWQCYNLLVSQKNGHAVFVKPQMSWYSWAHLCVCVSLLLISEICWAGHVYWLYHGHKMQDVAYLNAVFSDFNFCALKSKIILPGVAIVVVWDTELRSYLWICGYWTCGLTWKRISSEPLNLLLSQLGDYFASARYAVLMLKWIC
jgi:hypothetical protein